MICPHCRGNAGHGPHGAGVCTSAPVSGAATFRCTGPCGKALPLASFYIVAKTGRPNGKCRDCKRVEYEQKRGPLNPLKSAAYEYCHSKKGSEAEHQARCHLLVVASETDQ